MPWFVMYRFPAEFAGSALCWRGDVLWEGADGHFDPIHHRSTACQTLTPEDAGRRIFGVAIRQDPPLAMRLEPTTTIRLWRLVGPALALIAGAAVLGLLVRPRLRRTIVPFMLIVLALAVAFFTEANFIGGVRPFDAGDDGLVYDGLAPHDASAARGRRRARRAARAGRTSSISRPARATCARSST